MHQVFKFTAGEIGIVYDMKSTDIATFTNDSTDVRDLEVYKVDGEFLTNRKATQCNYITRFESKFQQFYTLSR